MPGAPEISKPPRSMIVGVFWSIAALGLLGLITLLGLYSHLWDRGARDESLFIPFVIGAMLIGAISMMMIWQLSRLISAFRHSNQDNVPDRPLIRDVRPMQIATPADQIRSGGEHASVVEHTTRQIAKGQSEYRQK
jgi:hypothetical protein